MKRRVPHSRLLRILKVCQSYSIAMYAHLSQGSRNLQKKSKMWYEICSRTVTVEEGNLQYLKRGEVFFLKSHTFALVAGTFNKRSEICYPNKGRFFLIFILILTKKGKTLDLNFRTKRNKFISFGFQCGFEIQMKTKKGSSPCLLDELRPAPLKNKNTFAHLDSSQSCWFKLNKFV